MRFNCAQASDVAHALGYTKRTLADMIKLGKRAVMFGRSRGSLVALHVFLCLNDEERKHVAFLLLEGAFYDSRSVSRSRYGTGVASWITWILPWISEWRPTGYDIFRHELRTLRDNKVPIAIVTSMADQVVPVENANELYEVLRGYQQRAPLGFLTLTHSSHDGYAYEHDDDRDAYAKLLRELMASHSGSRGRTNV